MTLRWGYVACPRPKVPFEYYWGCCMAWLEQRGDTFRIAFRFRGEKFRVPGLCETFHQTSCCADDAGVERGYVNGAPLRNGRQAVRKYFQYKVGNFLRIEVQS